LHCFFDSLQIVGVLEVIKQKTDICRIEVKLFIKNVDSIPVVFKV